MDNSELEVSNLLKEIVRLEQHVHALKLINKQRRAEVKRQRRTIGRLVHLIACIVEAEEDMIMDEKLCDYIWKVLKEVGLTLEDAIPDDETSQRDVWWEKEKSQRLVNTEMEVLWVTWADDVL